MNSNIYYIIGAFAAIYLFSKFIHKKSIAKKNNEETLNSIGGNDSFSKNSIPESTAGVLSEKKRKLLAYGVILAYHKREDLLGINPKANTNVDEYAVGLKNQWEISNSEEAHERINALIVLNRSKEFDAVLIESPASVEKIRKKIEKELKIDLDEVKETTSTYAWDIGRVIPLIKWCYWVGYINEMECWSYMNEASEVAKQKGKNWTDYTVSFLLGRTMQGFDMDDICVEAYLVLNGKKPMFGNIDDIDVFQKYSFH